MEEEGETEQRSSRFILFKRTLVGASSATGAAAAVTTTVTAKATTPSRDSYRLYRREGGWGPLSLPGAARTRGPRGKGPESSWAAAAAARSIRWGKRKEREGENALPHYAFTMPRPRITRPCSGPGVTCSVLSGSVEMLIGSCTNSYGDLSLSDIPLSTVCVPRRLTPSPASAHCFVLSPWPCPTACAAAYTRASGGLSGGVTRAHGLLLAVACAMAAPVPTACMAATPASVAW